MNNETNLEIDAPEGVESIWELFTPKSNDLRNLKVKRTAVFFFTYARGQIISVSTQNSAMLEIVTTQLRHKTKFG